MYITDSKIVSNILMGFKIECQVGGGGTQFSKLPDLREFSNILIQTCHFFRVSLGDLKNHHFFLISKT